MSGISETISVMGAFKVIRTILNFGNLSLGFSIIRHTFAPGPPDLLQICTLTTFQLIIENGSIDRFGQHPKRSMNCSCFVVIWYGYISPTSFKVDRFLQGFDRAIALMDRGRMYICNRVHSIMSGSVLLCSEPDIIECARSYNNTVTAS